MTRLATSIVMPALALLASNAAAQPARVKPQASAPAACKDAKTCVDLAVAALQRNDLAGSTTYLQRACDLGSADGCAGLGKAYDIGRGVKVDQVRAARFYRVACKGGVVNACHNLALGIWSKKMAGRPDEAIALMTQACAAGSTSSCAERDRMTAATRPPPPPPTAAATTGCSAANPSACLAVCLQGTTLAACRDAARWGRYTPAQWLSIDQHKCGLQDWFACLHAGWSFERAHDPLRALGFYQQACDRGRVGCASMKKLTACKKQPNKCPTPIIPAEIDDEADL